MAGSINMDLVIRCPTLPRPGETVTARSAEEICGGKGANQAVAAARCGGRVSMIGRVGSDALAGSLTRNLKRQDVNIDAVAKTDDCGSGLAIVSVEDSGENAIHLVAGANGRVTPADIRRHADRITAADVLMLQLEIPTAAVIEAIRIARQNGVRVILDPAPVAPDWTDELMAVDLICPNESEAAALTGATVGTRAGAERAAQILHDRGAKNVIITRGRHGSVVLGGGRIDHVDAMPVTAVDTTAAGDGFAGALAVRWAETDDLLAAVRFATVAGAIAATRRGAQPGLASRREIEDQVHHFQSRSNEHQSPG